MRTIRKAGVPVADQLCFLGLSAGQASYQRQVRYLHAGPADLQHGNERDVIAELEPRAGRRTTETADEHKRETERHHHETCIQRSTGSTSGNDMMDYSNVRPKADE